jgi:site-specific recombinase XerC
MDENKKLPLLFSYYFGDSAVSAQRGASRRLKKWSRAFEQWIDSRRRGYQVDTVKHALLAWKRFVCRCPKMPWQMTRQDIEHHTAWMEQEGFAAGTINGSIGFIASFFEWCAEQRVDTACEAGFNPAKDAARSKRISSAGVNMWSREQLAALLDLLSRDPSVLGKRDYAFFLARLSLGVPLKTLQVFEWGQVEQDRLGAWVRWSKAGERLSLPDQVWQAVMQYLQASGRLEGMCPGRYIFAPQVQPVVEGSGAKAEDWLEGQPLSNSAIISSLKLYGRQVGIPESKLTLAALRWTAIRLRLDQGESLAGMQVFMDTRAKIKSIKYRLGRLPELPGGSTHDSQAQGRDAQVPLRQTRRLVGGESTTHGFFTHKQDVPAVKAVMAENIHGVDGEIACLRKLMRGLLDQAGDEAPLLAAYSQTTHRLSGLVSARAPLKKGKKDPWAEELLSKLDEIETGEGRPPVSLQVREQALGLSPDEVDATGMVTEEIATIRLLLRNLYRRAMQGIGSHEYLRLVELYDLGCVRLARLLKIGGGDGDDRLARYLQDTIDKAIADLTREWGLDSQG